MKINVTTPILMKRTGLIKLLLILFFCQITTNFLSASNRDGSANQFVQSSDFYWISFTSFLNGSADGTTFLMKIDSVGNVIKKSTEVVSPAQFRSHRPVTGITRNGADRINIWMQANRGARATAEIDKRTFTLKKIVSTGLKTNLPRWELGPVSVTQKPHNNFVVGKRRSGDSNKISDFVAQGVSPTGISKKESWVLDERVFDAIECGTVCNGGVSADGKAAFWDVAGLDYHPQLFIQRLDNFGKPAGFFGVIGNQSDTTDPISAGAAASNVRADGSVTVVYKFNPSDYDLAGRMPTQLFVRIFNTQAPSSAPILIASINSQFAKFSDVAIDPLGRFILYAATKKRPTRSLYFQALDITGHASGKPKLLVRPFDSGLHMLKETE